MGFSKRRVWGVEMGGEERGMCGGGDRVLRRGNAGICIVWFSSGGG